MSEATACAACAAFICSRTLKQKTHRNATGRDHDRRFAVILPGSRFGVILALVH